MTTLVGKDAPLEESIERFRSNLLKLNLEVTESNWLNPLPNVFSVHLSLNNCPVIYSNGKGSSKEAALASAYGELFERLSTHMSFSDYFFRFLIPCGLGNIIGGTLIFTLLVYYQVAKDLKQVKNRK